MDTVIRMRVRGSAQNTYQEGADLTVASGEAPLASAAPTPGTPRKPSARTRKP